MSDISQVITKVVEIMGESMPWCTFEIIDTEMVQKHPNIHAPNGYWGVTISIDSCVQKREVFLKYQLCEDILFYGAQGRNIADNFVFSIIGEDLPELKKMVLKIERRNKLQKINEK